ncbi:GNAT family N-acetyltransferase [Ornithinimicrobium cavernae]|uniref:GNAT family N-acetyltransferase n=1 Tax=Ornithinimicrobium cavernae TaxID=2666047 RepID=UPI000D692A19|nr:GNAT family N-acetyltransferase [Ornithinimicrobium cavernae]
MTELVVTDNPALHRYEAHLDGRLAGFVDYHPTTELRALTHTEVDTAFEGQGVGGALARATLDDIRERGTKALVTCPFLLAWVGRNPEYADVLYGASRSAVTD